jgi:CO/xanthine dehydrogenase Mo-binding subunit
VGQERLPGSLQNNRKLDGWIRINADGSATVYTGKVELGQGILTALAQIAAEEIDLPLARVRMISGDTRQTPTKVRLRQPIDREQRYSFAHGMRRGSRDLDRPRGEAARRGSGSIEGRRRRRLGA